MLLAGPALLPGETARAAATCGYTRIDDHARVDYVYDGDTVRLQDGRRVRLIGINTPEIGHHGATSEPLAVQARKVLQRELGSGHDRVQLQYGRERHDHYGRLLAHLYLENGDNLAVPLLRQGLATTLVVPPNTRAASCYQALEDQARARRIGLWQLPRYQPRNSSRLSTDLRGFAIVRGRVQAVRNSRHSTWIDLDGPLSPLAGNPARQESRGARLAASGSQAPANENTAPRGTGVAAALKIVQQAVFTPSLQLYTVSMYPSYNNRTCLDPSHGNSCRMTPAGTLPSGHGAIRYWCRDRNRP